MTRKAARVIFLVLLVTMASGVASAQGQCGLQTLKGTFAFHYTGGLPGTPAYGVGIGVVSFDGTGKGSHTETVSINGAIFKGVPADVEYTVKPNCSGTITWTYPTFGGLKVEGEFVIADNGKSMYATGTDEGSISLGFYTRQ